MECKWQSPCRQNYSHDRAHPERLAFCLNTIPNELRQVCLSPRSERQHKAWGGAKRNPRIITQRTCRAREAADSGCDYKNALIPLSAAPRALIIFNWRVPGVPLRFTPGFKLTPGPRDSALFPICPSVLFCFLSANIGVNLRLIYCAAVSFFHDD